VTVSLSRENCSWLKVCRLAVSISFSQNMVQ
jgi:hypothetical protein